MEDKDFFYQASGLFLTKNLTSDEFDDILQEGRVLPICEDYETWDPDYLKNIIYRFSSELLKAYEEGKK
tara:strand:- start:1472 stop:1678 length:207 start_codon:yes stop_codon:yes gene_type:complete